MRAAAIFGLGSSPRDLQPFQDDPGITWTLGLPAPGEADVVLVFGGDGTVHRHLGPLVTLGLPVLVVPRGSGNDFARALGIGGIRDAFEAWRKFGSGPNRARAIDLGIIRPLAPSQKTPLMESDPGNTSEQYFCCVAGVGLDAAVTARANRLPRWLRSHGGYALSLPGALLSFKAPHVTISEQNSDRERNLRPQYSDRALLAAFANSPVFGGGMHIAPRAQMDDGLLDVCVVGNLAKFKLLSLFPTVYAGHHLGIKHVEYFQAKCVRVQTEVPLDVYADGEYVCQTPVEIRIAAGALRVVTPG